MPGGISLTAVAEVMRLLASHSPCRNVYCERKKKGMNSFGQPKTVGRNNTLFLSKIPVS